jgi:hypothetical protein
MFFRSKNSIGALLGGVYCAAMFLPLPAFADGGPIVIDGQTPAYIPPSPGVAVDLQVSGRNIVPDGVNHPYYLQYWHIWVRSIDARGAAGRWTHCESANGCAATGFDASDLYLQIDGSQWAATERSQFQMHYFYGLDDPSVSDPSQSKTGLASAWSTTVTWNVQTAPPPVAATPKAPPHYVRATNVNKLAPPLALSTKSAPAKPMGAELKAKPPQ